MHLRGLACSSHRFIHTRTYNSNDQSDSIVLSFPFSPPRGIGVWTRCYRILWSSISISCFFGFCATGGLILGVWRLGRHGHCCSRSARGPPLDRPVGLFIRCVRFDGFQQCDDRVVEFSCRIEAFVAEIGASEGATSYAEEEERQLSRAICSLWIIDRGTEGSGSDGKKPEKKFITKEQEPEQYWQTADERDGKNPMSTPLPYIVILSVLSPFIILAVAFANNWIKVPLR